MKDNQVSEIKKLIQKECADSKFVKDWFFGIHILGVAKFAKELLKKIPKVDREVVMLGVWLHDLQRIRGKKGDHAKVGAVEAEKVMTQFNYPKEKIEKVKEIILSHSCDTHVRPKTLEGKILASADAMSHYINDFYIAIAVTGERNLAEYKEWVLEKLDRNYNKKISLSIAKKMIKHRHQIAKEFFTMK